MICTSVDEGMTGDGSGSEVGKSRCVIVVFPHNVENGLGGGGIGGGDGACVWKSVGVATPDELEGSSMMYRNTDTVYSSSVALAFSGPVALFRLASCVVAYTVMLMFVGPDAGATPDIERLLTSKTSHETMGVSSNERTASAEFHNRGTKSIVTCRVRKVLKTTRLLKMSRLKTSV